MRIDNTLDPQKSEYGTNSVIASIRWNAFEESEAASEPVVDHLREIAEKLYKSVFYKAFFKTGGFLLRFVNHQSFRLCATSTPMTLFEIYSDQIKKSFVHQASETADHHIPLSSINTRFSRSHYQLPCTAMTRQKKCRRIMENASKTDAILLVGDDDLVSLELKRLGFSNVTVLDIDARLINYIQKNTDFECFVHDLRHAIPLKLRRAYKVISTDPPNEIGWIKLFLKRCKQASTTVDTTFIVCTNPMSLFPAGLDAFNRFIEQENYVITSHIIGENAYKMPQMLRAVLFFVIHSARLITLPKHTKWVHNFVLEYFSSDTLVLLPRK